MPLLLEEPVTAFVLRKDDRVLLAHTDPWTPAMSTEGNPVTVELIRDPYKVTHIMARIPRARYFTEYRCVGRIVSGDPRTDGTLIEFTLNQNQLIHRTD